MQNDECRSICIHHSSFIIHHSVLVQRELEFFAVVVLRAAGILPWNRGIVPQRFSAFVPSRMVGRGTGRLPAARIRLGARVGARTTLRAVPAPQQSPILRPGHRRW